ncbi:MAG: SpoIIE family protein phosphatase, partial [Bacteroidales bacterium]|nr:SpoIIE family protein phosphatase [Bacteroidales bacterium]
FIYTDDENFGDALTYFERAFKTAQREENEEAVSGCETDVAYILMVQKEYRKAIDKLLHAVEIAQRIDNKPLTLKCYSMLQECYKALGMNAQYMDYQNKMINYNKHLQREASQKEVTELQEKNTAEKERSDLEARAFELERQLADRERADRERSLEEERKLREMERDAQQKEKERLEEQKAQIQRDKENTERLLKAEAANTNYFRAILYGGGIFLLLLLIILFLLWLSSRKRKRLNMQLQENNQIIEDQNKMLEDWSKELQVAYDEVTSQKQSISDSIKYAEHIQRSMLLDPATIKQAIPQCMVFFRPRDIVSGDFYWYHKSGNKMYIAAIDCTGHGVPGAMISMVGYNILENIMQNTKFVHPNEIMDQMHMDIRHTLRQDTTENHDGMDMALCMINPATQTVEYCGAKNALVICRPGMEAEKIKPDTFGIGGMVVDDPDNPNPTGARRFTNHKIKADEDTTFYIFSDGFSDQFGGADNKKYMLGKFRRMLSNVAMFPMKDQELMLDAELKDWRGDTEQTDDILIIGFKLGSTVS